MLTVLLEDGPAGPKHVGQCSKLVCPKFILLRVMCWPFNEVRFVYKHKVTVHEDKNQSTSSCSSDSRRSHGSLSDAQTWHSKLPLKDHPASKLVHFPPFHRASTLTQHSFSVLWLRKTGNNRQNLESPGAELTDQVAEYPVSTPDRDKHFFLLRKNLDSVQPPI
jgi:hypothetical protein